MQLNNLEILPELTKRSNFSIFQLPKDTDFSKILPNSYHVKPEGKSNSITIDVVRLVDELASAKQTADFNIVIEQAERMNEKATNAFLKNLEEPRELVHFIFLCHNADSLIPTVRSRAFIYYLPENNHINSPLSASPDIQALAKSYLTATPKTIYPIAEKISKLSKDQSRQKALEVVDVAIEIAYKSYFKTGKTQFLDSLQKLLATESALSQNGGVKLQLVANML